jgi:HAD superfamily hydrolase (TIGR01549 family)
MARARMRERQMSIQGVIFDLGHTLMYLDSTWPEVFERGVTDLAAFVTSQGLALDGEAFARALLDRRAEGFAQARQTMREVTAEASIRWTFAHFGVADPSTALVTGAIDAFFAYEEDRWLAFPEALPVLRELARRGLRLGLFSNATHDPFIQNLVDRLGFRPWLNPALSSAGTGIRKPDPAAFAPILAAWGMPPEPVVVVGDTLDADILGARQAGMHSVWLHTREDARQEGNETHQSVSATAIMPDAAIEHLDELLTCLERL